MSTKTALIDYLEALKTSKYSERDNEEHIVKSKKLTEIIDYLKTSGTGPTLDEFDAYQELYNGNLYEEFDIYDDATKITYNLTADQTSHIANIISKKIIALRVRNTSSRPPETITDYENYLEDKYNKIGISIPKVNCGTTEIRTRYPHEETTITGVDEVIYLPNNGISNATREYYKEYYEDIIGRITIPTANKNKADFINLLNSMDSGATYNAKRDVNNTEIRDIITALTADTTDQAATDLNVTIAVPTKYILGHHSETYTFVVKDETANNISQKLKNIFTMGYGNDINITEGTKLQALKTMKKRNRYAINGINNYLTQVINNPRHNNSAKENRAKEHLEKMKEILDFNPGDFTDPDAFLELVGGYIPASKKAAFERAARALANSDIDISFERDINLPYFLPVIIPKNPPADVNNAVEYEEKLKEAYKNGAPRLFQEPENPDFPKDKVYDYKRGLGWGWTPAFLQKAEYKYKKGRHAYPHERLRWGPNGDPIIEDEITDRIARENKHAEYYEKVYKKYLEGRTKEGKRRIKKIKKAPKELLRYSFLQSVRQALRIDKHMGWNNNITPDEPVKRFKAKAEILLTTVTITIIIKSFSSLVFKFGASAIFPWFFAGSYSTLAIFFWAVRILKTRRTEIFLSRAGRSFSDSLLEDAHEVVAKIVTRTTAGADDKEIEQLENEVILQVAYLIANYIQYKETFPHLSKEEQDDKEDDMQMMEDQYTQAQTDFAEYWDDAEKNIYRFVEEGEVVNREKAIKIIAENKLGPKLKTGGRRI